MALGARGAVGWGWSTIGALLSLGEASLELAQLLQGVEPLALEHPETVLKVIEPSRVRRGLVL
jgi:hypothetical protein